MSAWQQNSYGRWVPAEPMPTPFGIRWEQAIRFRRVELRQGRVRSFVGGWLDTRAVDRMAR